MNNTQTLEAGFVLHGAKEREYKIERVLGRGGCGILYHATSIVMDGNIPQTHEYAIKEYFDKDCCRRTNSGSVELMNDSEENREVREEFRSEAVCLKNLKPHGNIVRVNEVFEDNGTFYYVMEYLNGPTLRQYAKENKLSETQAVEIIAEVAKALDYLHSEYINHLDIKPDNIMMVGSGKSCRPVLIDFGLSKHFKKNGSPKGRQGYDGASDGYSPKEQYEGIDRFSPEADVYSLAATLFFLLTDNNPCHAKEMNLRYLSKHLPDSISDSTINAMNNAMNADKARRTQDIATFYHELTGKALHATGGGVPTMKFDRKKKQNISTSADNKWKTISIIAAVLLLLVLAVVLIPKSGEKENNLVHTADTIANENTDELLSQSTSPNKDVEPIEEKPVDKESSPSHKVEDTPAIDNTPVQQSPAVTKGTLDLGYATYTGGIKNGKPDGVGTMRFRRSHRIDSNTTAEAGDVFDGSYTDGHIDDGKLIRSNGETITIIGEN